jgi:hypothetical protein
VATLMLDRPLTTTEPVVQVDPRLPPGRYRAELVVVDELGATSKPAGVDFEIREGRVVTRPRGTRGRP